MSFSSGSVIGEGHLDGGFNRLGSGVPEEDVVESSRRQSSDAFGRFESSVVPPDKGSCEVELEQLCMDGVCDFSPAVTQRRAKKSRAGVEDFMPRLAPVVDALGPGKILRVGSEFTVWSEGQPVVTLGIGGCHRDFSERRATRSSSLCISTADVSGA